MRLGRFLFAWLLTSVVACVHAQGAVWVEFIDQGVPTNGVYTMHGWRGVTIRISTDGEPIQSIALGIGNAGTNGIFGAIAQRWTDPHGQSCWGCVHTEFSIGPIQADNTSPSDFNFDTHILGQPSDFSLILGSTEQLGAYPLSMERTGIPSTGFVVYGATMPRPISATEDPVELTLGGRLWGNFTMSPTAISTMVDIAYVVTDSRFGFSAFVTTGTQEHFVYELYEVPEPTCMIMIVVAGMLLARKR
jgi:hypothetical protein